MINAPPVNFSYDIVAFFRLRVKHRTDFIESARNCGVVGRSMKSAVFFLTELYVFICFFDYKNFG